MSKPELIISTSVDENNGTKESETPNNEYLNTRSSRPEMFCKKGVLKKFAKFAGKYLCQSLFFNKVSGLKALAQVFSCEFCGIFKNTCFYRTLLVAASVWL